MRYPTIFFALFFPIILFTLEGGTYNVTGYDPYIKSPYSGTVDLKEAENGVWNAEWKIDGEKFVGTGLLSQGELNFVFYEQNEPPERKPRIGLQIYKIQDSTLEGRWVFLNNSLVGTERLTKK